MLRTSQTCAKNKQEYRVSTEGLCKQYKIYVYNIVYINSVLLRNIVYTTIVIRKIVYVTMLCTLSYVPKDNVHNIVIHNKYRISILYT